MKRAKIFLIAIGVCAIMGGVLAFRANRLSICYCRIWSPGVCSITYLNASFSITTGGSTYCTFEHGELCQQKVVTFIQP